MQDIIQKTKEKIYIEATHLARNTSQTTGKKNDFYITLKQLEIILENACPCDCSDQKPYGFVVEADCPVHDMPNKSPLN